MPRPPSRSPILASLSTIEVARPADLILRQLRALIASGALHPGERLPAERELARRFGVGRSHVRDALRRLELYGILQTHPQSGTVVARLGVAALEGLIGNVIALDRDDVVALSETRTALEVETARRAAERATRAEIRAIAAAQEVFRARALEGDSALAEDLALHLTIARASRNPVLASLVGLITPDIMRLNGERATCSRARLGIVVREHQAIVDAIAAHDPDAAGRAMAEHARMARDQHRSAPAPHRRRPSRQSRSRETPSARS